MTTLRRLHETENRRIQAAIEEAEKATSGEIRVFIDRKCESNVLDSAAYVFERLGMNKTEKRNGVLIYLAIESRQFAVIGDQGIHQHVGDELWHDVRTSMQHFFQLGGFATGLEQGILRIGEELRRYFPYTEDDVNELPNEIVYGFKDDIQP